MSAQPISESAPFRPSRTESLLDPESVVKLRRADFEGVPSPQDCPYDEIERFLLEAELALGDFPRDVRRQLLTFRNDGNVDGVLLLRGFPRDAYLPPTPLEPNRDARRQTYLAELFMGAVATALGQPVGYAQEKGGKVFQGLYPLPEQAHMQTNASSIAFLKFHTEVAFHRHMLAYVILCGLRQDRERRAQTIVSSIRRVLSHLTFTHRAELFQPQFSTKVDASFGGGDGPTCAVLSGDPADPSLRFDDDFMTAATPAGERALAALRAAINKEKREITVEPGDILVIDNHRAVHARSEFFPHYDGNDRYLLRLGVVRDLRLSLQERVPGTRIIASDTFSAI